METLKKNEHYTKIVQIKISIFLNYSCHVLNKGEIKTMIKWHQLMTIKIYDWAI